jgi:hypothetical protein
VGEEEDGVKWAASEERRLRAADAMLLVGRLGSQCLMCLGGLRKGEG